MVTKFSIFDQARRYRQLKNDDFELNPSIPLDRVIFRTETYRLLFYRIFSVANFSKANYFYHNSLLISSQLLSSLLEKFASDKYSTVVPRGSHAVKR